MKTSAEKFASRQVLQASAHLGRLIKNARRAQRMPITELAMRAGTSHPTIIRIEAGKPGAALGTVLSVMEQLGLLPLITGLRDIKSEDLLAQQAPSRGRSKAPSSDMDF